MRTTLLLASLTLLGCGDTSPNPAPPPAPVPAPAAAVPAPAVEAASVNVVTVQGDTALVALEGNDQMMYNTKQIVVPAGKKVKLTLTHTGKLPAAAMGHDFVLLKKGTDGQAFATAALTATDHIPATMAGQVIAHTKVVGGGESVTIEFVAPAPGDYPFLCSFPGHYALMNGIFRVEG